ncbi:MAG: ATP synthase F1 subunit delta [Polyangiales bacterium]
MSNLVARRYARALYMIGVEENRLDALAREVKSLGDTVRTSAELASFLSNPVVPQAARRAVVTELLGRLTLSPVARNFALMLADRRRGHLLPDVADALAALSDERAGKVQAQVTSATALTDAQVQKVRAALERLTGKAVSVSHRVDPSLIGGMVTRIGDKVYDGSLRTRLDEIRQAAAGASN